MPKITKEDIKQIEEKLKYLGLDLDNVPKIYTQIENVNYKPINSYEETKYAVYKYLNVNDIEILLSPTDRITDIKQRYNLASPIYSYLVPQNSEDIEKHAIFLNMLNSLRIEKIEEIEKDQKELLKKPPFNIKYDGNYLWQIYYSEIKDKYFMLLPIKDNQYENLFYLIKKQIENKNTKIFVPIADAEYSSKYLKKSEITDLENYLWLFTNNWANIYEVYDKDENMSIQIIGKTKVYDNIESEYKIILNNKEEAQKYYKLMKVLFILQTELPKEYNFCAKISKKGDLEFYNKSKKITYENISEFIKNEIDNKTENINKAEIQIKSKKVELKEIKNEENLKTQEFLQKEKQITLFLECKKTFFGKIKYFIKSKKINRSIECIQNEKQEVIDENINKNDVENNYNISNTIDDLLKITKQEEGKIEELKNIELDINSLKNKIENLSRKIKNANLYLEEIDSHKKSIFEFWKYANKDNILELQAAHEEEKTNTLKKTFEYEDDIEELGIKTDKIQKITLSKYECDAMFTILNLGEEIFNKKAEKDLLEKSLNNLKSEFLKDDSKEDFDIFGGVVEDRTKIKYLKDKKHREIEKNIYKILQISKNITIEEYSETIQNLTNLLESAYLKIKASCDISVYKITNNNEEIQNNDFSIFNMNSQDEIEQNLNELKEVTLNKINIKEGANCLFYSNIMFFDNFNKTLPNGMDISTKILLNLNKLKLKQINKSKFNMIIDSKVYIINTIEYDLN